MNSKDKQDPEAALKNSEGIDMASHVAKDVSAAIKEIPVVGDVYKPIANVASAAGTVVSNLSRPLSNAAASFMINRPGHDVGTVNGMSYAERMSLYTNARVKHLFGSNSSDMLIAKMAQKPMLLAQTTFSSQGEGFDIYNHPFVFQYGTNIEKPDYLAFCGAAFRYWRGSIKYLFQFIGSPFYSFQARIYFTPSLTTITSNSGGDFFSKVIDIKGDTTVEVVAPYISNVAWTEYYTTSATIDVSTLGLVLLTDVQGSSLPAEAKYYLNIYRAGGEDIQFAQHSPPWIFDGDDGVRVVPAFQGRKNFIRRQRNPRIVKKKGYQKQMDLTSVFDKPFHSFVPDITGVLEHGIVSPELCGTISDLIKKPSATGNFTTYPTTGFPGEKRTQWLYYWGCAFYYWRGSRRMMMVPDDVNVGRVLIPELETTTLDDYKYSYMGPIAFFSSSVVEDVEVPYYHINPLYYTEDRLEYDPTLAHPADIGFSTISNRTYLLSAGDDFQYIWYCPPIIPLRPAPQKKADTSFSNIKTENKYG
jgi:hypothetical protein